MDFLRNHQLKRLNIFPRGGSKYLNAPINFFGEEKIVKTIQRFWGLGLRKQLIILGVLGLSFLTGCSTAGMASPSPYLLPGAGIGAALGAGLGAAINNQNPWRGAAIGGLLGAAGGGVAGEVYGRSQTPYQPQQSGACQPQPQQGYYQQPQQGYYQPQQGNYQPAPYYGPPPS